MWRTHSCVPRRDSSRCQRVTISTMKVFLAGVVLSSRRYFLRPTHPPRSSSPTSSAEKAAPTPPCDFSNRLDPSQPRPRLRQRHFPQRRRRLDLDPATPRHRRRQHLAIRRDNLRHRQRFLSQPLYSESRVTCHPVPSSSLKTCTFPGCARNWIIRAARNTSKPSAEKATA